MKVRIPDSIIYLIFTFFSTQLSYIIFDILFINIDFNKLIRYSLNSTFILFSLVWFDKKFRIEFILILMVYFLLQFCFRFVIIKPFMLAYLEPIYIYIYFYFFLRNYGLNLFIITISFLTLLLSHFVWQLFTVLIATTIIQFVSRQSYSPRKLREIHTNVE